MDGEIKQEKKRKIKIAPYEYLEKMEDEYYKNHTWYCYENDEEFLKYHSNIVKYIRRTDLELEVEK